MDDLQLDGRTRTIYNIDETSFSLDPSKTKVVGEVNKPSSRIVSGPGRENTTVLFGSNTVLFGANAAGEKLPPLIVFKGKNIWDSWMACDGNSYPNTSFAASTNGWTEAERFFNYMKNTFLKNCVPERPVLLVFDGHSTHLGQDVIDLAIENQITILPHSSHLLQPLDLIIYNHQNN